MSWVFPEPSRTRVILWQPQAQRARWSTRILDRMPFPHTWLSSFPWWIVGVVLLDCTCGYATNQMGKWRTNTNPSSYHSFVYLHTCIEWLLLFLVFANGSFASLIGAIIQGSSHRLGYQVRVDSDKASLQTWSAILGQYQFSECFLKGVTRDLLSSFDHN